MANGKLSDACSNQRKAPLQAVSSEPNLKLAEIASRFRNPPRHGGKTVSRIIRVKRKCRRMIVRVKNAIAAFSLRGPRVAPIAAKIRERHLQLEPLCCLSSCLVRGGCFAVVGFEATYVVITLIMIALRLYNGGQLQLWSEFESNFVSFVTHQLFLYIIVAFDMMTIVMMLAMIRGVTRINKDLMRIHWFFDYFSLGFNVFAFLIYVPVRSLTGAYQWNAIDAILALCITMQIPLQVWAISVVKSCLDFFILLHVFVEIAEI